MRTRESGFSMIELLIALSCVILMGTGVFLGSQNFLINGKYNTAKSNVAIISIAVNPYHSDVGNYPASLNTLTSKNGTLGPWLNNIALTDPWGTTYMYTYANINKKSAVWSYGANKQNNSGANVPTSFNGDDIGVFSELYY